MTKNSIFGSLQAFPFSLSTYKSLLACIIYLSRQFPKKETKIILFPFFCSCSWRNESITSLESRRQKGDPALYSALSQPSRVRLEFWQRFLIRKRSRAASKSADDEHFFKTTKLSKWRLEPHFSG